MNITIHDTRITLQADDASLSYTLLTKPDIADYSNATGRPLVKSYHLLKESIWERFGHCVQELEKHCQEDVHCICYMIAFGALYTPLLSSSQAKNVLFYGSTEAAPFLSLLQNFMTFLQADSSLVALPQNPFVFSGLANGSWHAVIIDLDTGCSLQVISDAMSKVRKDGTVLLYTSSNILTDDVAGLLSHAVKTSFSSCTVYVLTMDPALLDFIYPYTAEASVLMRSEELLVLIGDLRLLTQSMEEGNCRPEDCLHAVELLHQTENMLFASYDYLEDPKLTLCANTLKEAVMDYYIGACDMAGTTVYLDRLHLAAQGFYEAIEAEFQY